MRVSNIALLTVVAGVLFARSSVTAHHSFAAEFDASKPITLTGVITKMVWSNPHAWLHVDVKGPDGTVKSWAVEFASPNALYRQGWRKTDLPAGAKVTLEGFLAKDGSTTANAVKVTTSDGRPLFAGSSFGASGASGREGR